MRVLVPLYAFGSMGRALYDADVHAAAIERVADGWLVECIAPSDTAAFMAAIAKFGPGVKVLEVPRDTATGLQSGMAPKA